MALPTIDRIDDDQQDPLAAKRQRKAGPPSLASILGAVPGVAYGADQIGQAVQAGGARGAGIAVRGAATLPLVAAGEAIAGANNLIGGPARSLLSAVGPVAKNFYGGLVGTDPQASPLAAVNAGSGGASAPRPTLAAAAPSYDYSADVGTTTNRVNRSPLATAAQSVPAPQPRLADYTVPNTQLNGNTADIAGSNARLNATLAPMRAADDERMPANNAPQRGIAGDFDFATQAAADFAARKSNNPALIQSYINARSAETRGDVANKAAADSALTQAQTGETTGRMRNALALVPSEIGLKTSQAQENLARVPLSLAQATEAQARGSSLTALTPSQIGLNQANAGHLGATSELARAQAYATGSDADARSLLSPGALEQQRQATKRGALDLGAAQELDALRKGALSGDPNAEKKFAGYVKANAGKGDGSITEEDLIHAFVADHKANASNPNAGPQQSYAEFKSAVTGTQLPIGQNPRALSIQADVQAGKMKPEEGKRQLMALGYK